MNAEMVEWPVSEIRKTAELLTLRTAALGRVVKELDETKARVKRAEAAWETATAALLDEQERAERAEAALSLVHEGLGALIPEDWTSSKVPADGDFESIAVAWAEEQAGTLARVRELRDEAEVQVPALGDAVSAYVIDRAALDKVLDDA
jgi:hypothetical protein